MARAKSQSGKSTERIQSCPQSGGRGGYKTKREAEDASRIGKAAKCHYCAGWHPK